jgi:hypothetical protein
MRPRTYLLIFIAALTIRLINVAFLPVSAETLLAEDAALYWNGAEVLVEHGVIGRASADGTVILETERVPGYHLFLAGIRALFGASFYAVLFAQAVLDSLSCVLIAAIGAALPTAAAPRLALIAGLLAAATPNLIIHAGMILGDCLFLFLVAAMLAAGARFLRSGAGSWAALTGLALGLAILTRTLALPLPLLMAPIAVIAPLMHRRRVAPVIGIAILFLTVSLAPAAFWVHRNYVEFGAVALSSQNGTHLANWVAPMVRRAHDGASRDSGARDLQVVIAERMKQDAVDPAAMNAFEHSRVVSGYALEAIGDYPVQAIVKAWVQGAALNLGAPAVLLDPRVRALPHGSFDGAQGDGLSGRVLAFLRSAAPAYTAIAAAGVAGVVLVSLLTLYGWGRLAPQAPWAAFMAALCIGYFLMVNGPIGSPKYRLPFEPILILLVGFALIDLFDRWRGRRTSI